MHISQENPSVGPWGDMQGDVHCFIICTTLEATTACLTGRAYSKKNFQNDRYAIFRNKWLEMHVAMQMNPKNKAQWKIPFT